MVRIVTLSQKEEWNRLVGQCVFHDFYHTASYHALATDGTPCLFVYGDAKRYIAFPLLLRPIAGTSYYDITSVYGYCGPLFSQSEVDEEMCSAFSDALFRWMVAQRVVAAFTRLHPFLPLQQSLLSRLGNVVPIGETVWIDLSGQFRNGYSRSLRYQLNVAERHMCVRESCLPDDWTVFETIYGEAMNRLHAAPRYCFSSDYFAALRGSSDFVPKLYLADDRKQRVIGGAICILCKGVAQYHLGACCTDALSFSPLKLILDYACSDLQHKRQADCLHLGGGYGGAADTLFQFKSRFSPLRKQFYVWQCIVDQPVYEALVAERVGENIDRMSQNFFPLYRLY